MNFLRTPVPLFIAAFTAFAALTGCSLKEHAGSSRDRVRLSSTGSIGGSGSAGFQRFSTHKPRPTGDQASAFAPKRVSSPSPATGDGGASTTTSETAGGATTGDAQIAQTSSGGGDSEQAYSQPAEKRVPQSRIKPLRAGAIGGSGSRGFKNR